MNKAAAITDPAAFFFSGLWGGRFTLTKNYGNKQITWL